MQRVDGKIDLWSPRYTFTPQPLTSLATVEPGFTVRLSDMGGGQYSRRESRCSSSLISPLASLIASTSATKPVTPVALRAPELIFKESWDMSIDIWSFGCLVCGTSPSELHMLTNIYDVDPVLRISHRYPLVRNRHLGSD